MSKNHGLIPEHKPEPRPADPVIPLVLQRKSIISPIPREESIRRYGIWDLEALIDFDIDGGVRIQKGERFQVPGDMAVDLAIYRQAKFTDKRAIEEAEVLKKAEELGLSRNSKELAAFTSNTRPAKPGNKFVHAE